MPDRRGDRPDRLRQLGRVGVVGGAGDRGLGHLLRQARRAPTPAARATSSSSCATTPATPICCSRPPTRPGRPTTSTAATACTSAARHEPGRAYKVSYNRPFTTRGTSPEDWVFNAEYPMVRWLEANGYNVSYFTGVDTDRRGALNCSSTRCSCRSATTSTGRARSAPTSKRRARGRAPRVLQRQRGVLEDAVGDQHLTAATRRTARWSATRKRTPTRRSIRRPTCGPARGATRASARRPTAAGRKCADRHDLHGQLLAPARDHGPGGRRQDALLAQHRASRRWPPAPVATLPTGTLGYEWDEDVDNGVPARRPDPAVVDTTVSGVAAAAGLRLDVRPGTATHALTLYRHASGALVFGAGTVQWSWGLDGNHDRGSARRRASRCSRRRSTCSPTWASSR